MEKIKQIPKKRMTNIQRKKQRMLAPLFRVDGTTKLPFGSYVKIANRCKVSDTFVRYVLNPKRREWSLAIYRAAMSIIRDEAQKELALQQEVKETLRLHDEAFKNEEGGSDE